MNKGFNTYKENSTMGMSQLDLILTVYRGAIKFIEQAKVEFEAERLTEGRTACEKARKCIVHLYTTLDMEKGEDIAEKLGQLYAFMIEQLDLAVASKSLDLLDSVIALLTTIKEGWDGLKDADEKELVGANASNGIQIPQQQMNAEAKPPVKGITLSA